MKHQTIATETQLRWVILLFAIAPIFFVIPITHDAAWQMWIGRQMAHGADLYTEIVEVNPPLWFWMTVPLAAAAEALRVPSLTALVGFFVASMALSIGLTTRVIGRSTPLWPMLIAMIFPIQHFAQREHFLLIVAIPYVLLVARREQGDKVPTNTAALIGLAAAVGFALKPQFALVPLVLELWVWKAPRIRPETIVLALAAFAYSAALSAFEPDYLTNAVPLAMAAYDQFSSMNVDSLVPSLAAFLFASPLLLRARGEAGAFTVAGLTCYLVYLLQLKGWGYQAVPALGLLLVAVALVTHDSNLRKALGLASAILIIVPNLKPYATPREFVLDVPRGTSFAALSISPRAAWPLVEERQLKWPLRYFSLWMAPTIKPDVLNDLLCNPPDLLVIDDRKVNFSGQVESILPYFRVQQRGPISVYRRVAAPPRPERCRTIH